MALRKTIVACRRCGAQYIKAVDYTGDVLFIEYSDTGRSRQLYGSCRCLTCGAEMSSKNLRVIEVIR